MLDTILYTDPTMTDFNNGLNHSLKNKLSGLKHSQILNQVEIGPIRKPLSIEFYEKWLASNYHGDMAYLQTHLAIKKNPLLLNAQLKSVISIAQSYYPAVQKTEIKIPARVALYAQNEDYHHWLKQKLLTVIDQLQIDFPDEVFLPYVDSGPILERDMAYQNGLGWFGKNTCLIHPEHGSLFFIAEILTTVEIDYLDDIEPIPDFCGTCRKCIEICPTEALIAPRTLKADHCISYLTIEAKTPPPIELRKKIGDWFFGCDLCQTVCPWNEKVFRKKQFPKTPELSTEQTLSLAPETRQELVMYFQFLLTASNKKIQRFHLGSPLSRAGAKGLKRNALIVIANTRLVELKSEVRGLQTTELRELAEWTLHELG